VENQGSIGIRAYKSHPEYKCWIRDAVLKIMPTLVSICAEFNFKEEKRIVDAPVKIFSSVCNIEDK